jgi:hypothetical protein
MAVDDKSSICVGNTEKEQKIRGVRGMALREKSTSLHPHDFVFYAREETYTEQREPPQLRWYGSSKKLSFRQRQHLQSDKLPNFGGGSFAKRNWAGARVVFHPVRAQFRSGKIDPSDLSIYTRDSDQFTLIWKSMNVGPGLKLVAPKPSKCIDVQNAQNFTRRPDPIAV